MSKLDQKLIFPLMEEVVRLGETHLRVESWTQIEAAISVSHPSNTSFRVMIYNLLISFGTFIIIQMGIAEPQMGEAINIMSILSQVQAEGTCRESIRVFHLEAKDRKKKKIGKLVLSFFFGLYTKSRFGSSDGKASAYNAGDLGSIPGLKRSPGEGNGNPLQYSCLENPMGGGTW